MAADVLSKLGSKRALVLGGIFVQALNSPTVKIEKEPPTKSDLVPALGQEVLVTDPDWRALILDFIINNKSYPKDKEHERLARRAANYVVIATELFRHSASSGTLQVHLPVRWSPTPQRDPFGNLRKPCRSFHPGGQSF